MQVLTRRNFLNQVRLFYYEAKKKTMKKDSISIEIEQRPEEKKKTRENNHLLNIYQCSSAVSCSSIYFSPSPSVSPVHVLFSPELIDDDTPTIEKKQLRQRGEKIFSSL